MNKALGTRARHEQALGVVGRRDSRSPPAALLPLPAGPSHVEEASFDRIDVVEPYVRLAR